MSSPRDLPDDDGIDVSEGPRPSDFRVVSTALIPNWRTPFRCSVVARWPGYDRDTEWSPELVAAFDMWLADHPKVMARCWYHRQGYERAMRLAIRAIRSIGDVATWGQTSDGSEPSISEAIEATLAVEGWDDSDDVRLAGVLVAEPIVWADGTDYLTDGQHRMCALRAAGVPEVLVCVG